MMISQRFSLLAIFLAATALNASVTLAEGQADAPYAMPVVVVAANGKGVPAGRAVEVVMPIETKLAVELGVTGRILDPAGARLFGPNGQSVAVRISPVPLRETRKESTAPATGQLGVRIGFKTVAPIPPGRRAEYFLRFALQDADQAGALIPSSQQAHQKKPARLDDDGTAAGPPNIMWNFNEDDPKVFQPTASHATVKEGFGGYLIATADGKALSPVIGTYSGPIDTTRYTRIIVCVRRVGPTPASLVVNDQTHLRDASGSAELKTSFGIYQADLTGRPNWGLKDGHVSLRWGSDRGKPTTNDEIIIDWVRIVGDQPTVAAGPIRDTRPASRNAALVIEDVWRRPHVGTAYLYVRNTTKHPIKLSRLWINGRMESGKRWPVSDDRRSHWFDFLPETIAAGEVGQVRVHLRGDWRFRPVTLTVADEDAERISALIPAHDPAARFSDIAFSKQGKTVRLFIRSQSNITRLLVDGHDVTADTDLAAADPFRGTAMAVYHPQKPLAIGSYHIFQAVTAGDQRASYAARTLNNPFILGIYGAYKFKIYHDNGLNEYTSFASFGDEQLAELAKHGMLGAPMVFMKHFSPKKKGYTPTLDRATVEANVKPIAGRRTLAFYYGPDEPDGTDYYAGGVGFMARTVIAMQHFLMKLDPRTPTCLQIGNTARNLNYQIYAETMDYAASHCYALGGPFLAETFGVMRELRLASQPQPYLWVTQFYPLHRKDGYTGRFPEPEEMYVQMLAALAGGAKGFIHYMHSGSSVRLGGAGQDLPLWNAMKPMHEQIAAIGAVAVHSTPVNWAISGDDKLIVSSLLCDRNNLLITVINRTIESTPQGFTAPPIESGSLTIVLPDWMRADRLVQVLPGGGLNAIKYTRNDHGDIQIQLPRITTGAILWLKKDGGS